MKVDQDAPRSSEQAASATRQPARPRVLFDGGCPMCSREIAHYRRLDSAARLDWVDITDPGTVFPNDGITRARAMARFHVRDAGGVWQSGAFGFVEMWSHLAGYRHLARLLRALHLVGPLDRAYARFAAWRLSRRCRSDGVCRDTNRVPPEENAS